MDPIVASIYNITTNTLVVKFIYHFNLEEIRFPL